MIGSAAPIGSRGGPAKARWHARYADWAAGDAAWRAALRQLGAWAEAERHRAILWAPVLMVAGVAAYLWLKAEPPVWAGTAAVVGAFAAWMPLERRGAWPRILFRTLFFAALGFALVQLRAHALAAPVIAQQTPPVTVEGVLEVAERQPTGLRYTVRVIRIGAFEPGDTPHRVRVGWRSRPTAARPGDTVRIRAVLSPPPGPALPGGYDYARQLWFARIGGVGYSYGGARVVVPAEGFRPRAMIEAVRERVADRVQAKAGRAGAEGAGALAAALVTGKRERVPDAIVDRLRDTGLAHLLAISGLHMGLVCGFVFWSVRSALAQWERAALCWPIKKVAAATALACGAGYLVLSGAPVSAQRAFIMAAVTFGAVLVDRRAISLRNVALAALIVLLIRPEAAASAGFQMSFMAVTVLVAAFGWLEARRAYGPVGAPGRARRFVGGLFGTSLLAGLATGPFAAYHFGRIAVYGLPANMAVMPLVTLAIMPSAVAGLALMPLGLDAPCWWVMGRGLEAVLAVTGRIEGLPGAVRHVAQVPTGAWTLAVGGMLGACLLAAPWRVAGLAVLPLAAWAGTSPVLPDAFVGREARQVAVRVAGAEGDALSLLSRRRERFAAGAWMTHIGLDPVIRDAPKFGECGGPACTVTLADGRRLAVAQTPGAAASACRAADIVVYAGWTPVALEDCPALLVTAAGLEDSGPVSITGGAVATVAGRRGCRMWTPCPRAAP